ncbi:Alpha/beta hydrolase fold-1 [Astrocystis sublimbata]|nr:Alpha/beta hydrolase fold-1 [Astrocystis sublimbata]
MAAPTKPIIFFVPGAWHDPWCFDLVRKSLSTRGYQTEASALATVGSTVPTTGVFDDAAKVRSALTELIDEGKEVILVGHSYGGVVCSNSVDGLGIQQRSSKGLKGGIILILYLAAFAVPVGASLKGLLGDSYPPPWWDLSKEGFILPKTPEDIFYNDVDSTLTNKAIAALKPMPIQMSVDASAFDPRDGSFEVGYIFAENDQAIPLPVQNAMFSEFPAGSFAAHLKSGHLPFFSMPDKTADAIESASRFVAAKR